MGGLPLLLGIGVWAFIAIIGIHEALPWVLQNLTAEALWVIVYFGWRARGAVGRQSAVKKHAPAWPPIAAGGRRLRYAARPATHFTTRSPSRFGSVNANAIEHAESPRRSAAVGAGRSRIHHVRDYLALALIIALAVAGLNAPDRLARAFCLIQAHSSVTARWRSKRERRRLGHTRWPIVERSFEHTVATPPSVVATVRVTGPTGAPLLVFEGHGGRRTTRFVRAADGGQRGSREPGAGRAQDCALPTRARTGASCPLLTRAQPQRSRLMTITSGEHVSIGWRVCDDFGVRRLALRVRPIHPAKRTAHADPIDTELEAPAGDPRETEAETEIDLAAHPCTPAWKWKRVSSPSTRSLPRRRQPIRYASRCQRESLSATARAGCDRNSPTYPG